MLSLKLFFLIYTALTASGANADAAIDAGITAREFSANNSAFGSKENTAEIMGLFEKYQKEYGEKMKADAIETKNNAEFKGGKTLSRDESIRLMGTVVGGIANEEMAASEQQKRDSLGLEPDDQLYIFISKNMPENLINSYALEASYAGGLLVLKGIENDETLDSFIKGQFVKSMKPSGLGATMQIDPRLFDLFDIKAVPAIVYTNKPLTDVCNTESNVKCETLPSNEYFKISGNVTLGYALDSFVSAGAEGAARFKKAMANSFIADTPENPNIAKGILHAEYAEAMAKIAENMQPMASPDYEPGSHIPKTEFKNTMFGPMQMPVGTQLYLENAGSIKTVKQGFIE